MRILHFQVADDPWSLVHIWICDHCGAQSYLAFKSYYRVMRAAGAHRRRCRKWPNS